MKHNKPRRLGFDHGDDLIRMLGISLAHSSDEVQAEFFHNFAAECRSWGFINAEMQLAYVNAKLSDEDKELLAMIGFKDD
jgi:hypothetical protein